jgi:glucan endo-1,3-alpha-glucosidase
VTSLGCSTTAHAANIVNIVATYANSTAQAKYGGKTIVSTFAGEYCLNAGWQYVRTLLVARGVNPYIVPALFSDISQFKSYDWMDAEFNWNSGWPQGAAPLTTSSDQSYMSALGTKGYMPAVSPAFFTYYSPQSYNKNWIFRGDDWLLATRMEQLVAMRNNVVAAEIISWNGE